ncbi:MAG: hypothetical protein HY868_01075 [Chloroflexi bacterium]|nr:hypothetical protein [Chloroflexota bacterium]
MPTLDWQARDELAQRFAPHLVLFPESPELARPGTNAPSIGDYHPHGIELLLEKGSLAAGLFKPRQPATLDALATAAPNDQLILLDHLLPNREHAWKMYFDLVGRSRADRARVPVIAYARTQTRGEANLATRRATDLDKAGVPAPDEVGRPFFTPANASDDDLAIQYWFCYYYDDWANQHEGDWEGVCVFLRYADGDYRAVGASFYAHETGKRRHWSEVERARDAHALVYVAAGSHASYFQHVAMGYMTTVPGFIIPFIGVRLNVNFTTTRTDRVPDAKVCAPIAPRVELLPDPVGPPESDAPAWQHKKWLAFPGSWGVRILGKLGHAGPIGPSHKGLKWHHPFAWMERYCTPDFLVY